ncbi:MAG: hypothetical protein IT293_14560 [Deltaproteobacteria bacterium]|nr:hypothetical protein [Deltaproteobacteria bacterium]
MRRMLSMLLAALVLAGAGRVEARDFETIGAPLAIGDQLIFFYDARHDYTTFLAIRNVSGDEVRVSVLFYGPTFSTPLSKALTLPGGALEILDVGALREDGLNAQPGVAIATAVNLGGQPVASRALTGNFTVANLSIGSAFGAAAAARLAYQDDGDLADIGDVIDGSNNARLQNIRPSSALLAAYYDPRSLGPVADGGNQLVFINFEDDYQPRYGATIGSTTWNLSATRSNGAGINSTSFVATGVTVSDLASVAGAGVNGSAGSITFLAENDTQNLNRLVYFTEALGTFGTGYLLPQVTPR